MILAEAMRIKSWLKNVLIFIPLVFSGFFNSDSIIRILVAFISFSLVSSAVYIVNDIQDIEKDRNHPVKSKRPIALGKISPKQGFFLSLFCMVLGIAVLVIAGGRVSKTIPLLELTLYVVLNLGYSFGLKNYPILDVTILAVGFTIRVFFGAAVLGMGVSNWVLLTTFSGALYLSFGKRKNELKYYGTENRTALERYTEDFLDKSTQSFMTLCLVFYSLACVSDNTAAANMGVNLTWTIPLVMLICLKYNLDLSRMQEGDPVTVILGDRWLILLIAVYAVSVLSVLYLV